jgi:hypothetical protein
MSGGPEMTCCRFGSINGVLLPGGGARLSPLHKFYDTAAYLVELTLAANDAGNYFPVGFFESQIFHHVGRLFSRVIFRHGVLAWGFLQIIGQCLSQGLEES